MSDETTPHLIGNSFHLLAMSDGRTVHFKSVYPADKCVNTFHVSMQPAHGKKKSCDYGSAHLAHEQCTDLGGGQVQCPLLIYHQVVNSSGRSQDMTSNRPDESWMVTLDAATGEVQGSVEMYRGTHTQIFDKMMKMYDRVPFHFQSEGQNHAMQLKRLHVPGHALIQQKGKKESTGVMRLHKCWLDEQRHCHTCEGHMEGYPHTMDETPVLVDLDLGSTADMAVCPGVPERISSVTPQ